MKQRIVVQLTTGKREIKDVDVINGLAVTRAAVPGGPQWRVIHVKSGLSLAGHNDRNYAVKLRKWFERQQVNGVRLADVPGCELCAVSVEIARRITEELPEYPQIDDYVGHVRQGAARIAALIECN